MDNKHSAHPYPPIQVAGRDAKYAQAMLSNMGGINSEMSAVSSYFYNSIVTGWNERVAKIFRQISVVEMHHLEIFGKLALALGADPRLWECQGSNMVYWSPGYNSHPTELPAILKNALRAEQAAIRKYEYQARTIGDKNIVENLQRILIDEREHVEIFNMLIREAQ